jgi:hypothetical protein
MVWCAEWTFVQLQYQLLRVCSLHYVQCSVKGPRPAGQNGRVCVVDNTYFVAGQ